MATTLTGVVTNKGREKLARAFGYVGTSATCRAFQFVFGEGGYEILPGGGKGPKVPSPTLTTIEAGYPDPSYPSGLWWTAKELQPIDFSFVAPSMIEIRCKLNPSEANNTNISTSPKFFEIGIYDEDGDLIVYGTFDEQTKVATKSLIVFVQVYF